MTNEEKAKQIADRVFEAGFNEHISFYDMAKTSAIEIAKWKDEQFNEEKKDLFGLVNMLECNEKNQTIIEDLKALLQ